MDLKHGELATTLEREVIGAAIKASAIDLFGGSLAKEVERCLMLGRNTRALLFLRALDSFSSVYPKAIADGLIFSIEASHAASILIDDLLDGDAIRHGLPTTASLWGAGRSALTSHLLTSAAMASIRQEEYLCARLLECYALMCRAEACDVLLDRIDITLDNYIKRILPKTSALFGFALEAAAYVGGEARLSSFRQLGELLGEFYQLCNDYYDLQPERINARHSQWDKWQATLSLPIAIFADLYPNERFKLSRLGTSLSHSEWSDLLLLVWQTDVRSGCLAQIDTTANRILAILSELELAEPLAEICRSMLYIVHSPIFWFNEYTVAK